MMVAVILGLLPGCFRTGCDKDQDCKGDRVCTDGDCVPAPMKPPAPQPPAQQVAAPQVLAPEAPAVQQPTTPTRPAPRPAAAAPPRQTCGVCGEDCLDKADAVRTSDRAWATHLASQYCREDCTPGTAMVMRCHGYGLLVGQGITPH